MSATCETGMKDTHHHYRAAKELEKIVLKYEDQPISMLTTNESYPHALCQSSSTGLAHYENLLFLAQFLI